MDCHSVSLRWVLDGDLVTTVIYELCFRSKNYRLVDSSPVVVASFDIGITDRIFQTCLLFPCYRSLQFYILTKFSNIFTPARSVNLIYLRLVSIRATKTKKVPAVQCAATNSWNRGHYNKYQSKLDIRRTGEYEKSWQTRYCGNISDGWIYGKMWQ